MDSEAKKKKQGLALRGHILKSLQRPAKLHLFKRILLCSSNLLFSLLFPRGNMASLVSSYNSDFHEELKMEIYVKSHDFKMSTTNQKNYKTFIL